MDWNAIRKEWRAADNYSGIVQQQIWNRVAADYGEKPLPSFDDDPFLQHMSDILPLNKNMRTLDIGCGAGSYSMALAPAVQEAVGVDISPKMIAYADRHAEELGLRNVSFSVLDWSAADIDALGYTGAFDLVFARTTPAISDFETFDKMNRCARKYCIFEKPTRRKDQIQDAAFREIGLPTGTVDMDIPYAFAYLWYKGYEPVFWYRGTRWENHRTMEDTCAWCINRAKLHKSLTASEESTMRSYIEAQAKDGFVHETIETTLITIAWSVNN